MRAGPMIQFETKLVISRRLWGWEAEKGKVSKAWLEYAQLP